MDKELQLKDLFKSGKKLNVPSYQRAYAWEKEQLEQFVKDMLEVSTKQNGQYYFGHFILEEQGDHFEIIDGQQRITTFILFLMVCKLFSGNSYEFIDNFETVDYDQDSFTSIKNKLSNIEGEWTVNNFGLQSENTLSIHKIIFALNYFKKLFKNKKDKLQLSTEKDLINRYVETLTNAHISTHITKDKAVAVQIFELQNTRGIKLSLIEVVKAILMKAIYLHSETEETEYKINIIRNEFAEIYKLEEQTISNTFRGELLLEDILLHHLRVVDDGKKLIRKDDDNGAKFNTPIKNGNKEEVILKYINDKITERKPDEIVEYIINLSQSFRKSVELVSKVLPKYDEENKLIGDVLILDKKISLEFFILLFHLNQGTLIQDKEFISLWENFVFTRDFHNKYHRLRYTDNFEDLFFQISKNAIAPTAITLILKKFIANGFRKDSMDEGSLFKTVNNYISTNKQQILNNAFHFQREKMMYILYKYEISVGCDINKLRKIVKGGRSVEHILPQSWEWIWIGEEDEQNISARGKATQKEIESYINGLGNLLLITGSENSSKSNNHPQLKIYESCSGGFYDEHNKDRDKWGNHMEWKNYINNRGEKIFEFLEAFIKKNEIEQVSSLSTLN